MAASLQLLAALHAAGRLEEAERLGPEVETAGVALAAAKLTILGDVARRLGRHEVAVERFREAADLQSGSAALQFNLSTALAAIGRIVESDQVLDRAIQLDPGLGNARFERAWRALCRLDYARAATDFEASAQVGFAVAEAAEYALWCRRFVATAPAEDEPLVSVVIPCFNYGRFVEEAVESVRAQTHRRTEVIVVEGGSTDGVTPGIVARLAGRGVRVVNQDRPTRAGANRNAGIKASSGEIVCCLDADDKLEPTYLEKAVFVLDGLGYDIAGAGAAEFGTGSRTRAFTLRPQLADFERSNQLPVEAVFRKEVWRRAGGFRDFDHPDGHVHEDWDFWLRAVARGARVFNMSWERLVLIRGHDSPDRVSTGRRVLPVDRQRAILRELNSDVPS